MGSTGFVLGVHRLSRRPAPMAGRLPGRAGRAVARVVEPALRYRASRRDGAEVLVASTLNWVLDAGCLILAFVLLGVAVPWSGLLFAYGASKMAGWLSLLPGGIGALEGGMVGALVLTGSRAGPALAATLVYRVVSYWAVAGTGTAVFVVLTRRQRRGQAQ